MCVTTEMESWDRIKLGVKFHLYKMASVEKLIKALDNLRVLQPDGEEGASAAK